MTDSQLVSVVIPAYNAASTLDETLHSVRSQTHRALEIIVVDDSSSDDTRAIAERHAAVDDRVQVLAQVNAGVAAARNAGWRHAQSDLIAFVDADDLWAPTKIERRIEVLQAGGERVGLVYCWSVRIDSESKVYRVWEGPRWEGDVLHKIFLHNFVSNGSSALVRRQALIDACGFDSGLRAAGAEGCEDFLFYCRVAEKHHYAVVPEHLVGYRYLHQNMSSNRPRMLRSWLLVADQMLARHPEHSDALMRGFHGYSRWVVQDLLSNNYGQLPAVLSLLLCRYPSIALRVLLMDVPISLAKKVRNRLREVYRKTAKTTKVGTTRRFFMKEFD